MTPKEQIHIHVNCNSLCKKSWTFSSLLQTYPVCHFLVEKICHCPNWVPELWRPLGWPETGTDLLRLLFVFHQYIYTHLLGVVSLRKLYFWISFLGICGFVCLDLSGVVGDNHLWEEISTIGSRCSHGPTPSSTPDRTPLESSQIFLFLTPNKQTYKNIIRQSSNLFQINFQLTNKQWFFAKNKKSFQF